MHITSAFYAKNITSKHRCKKRSKKNFTKVKNVKEWQK